MSDVRSTGMARLLIVAITVLAWFLISNHCALAELKEASKTKTSCGQPCCGDQAPVKSKTENATECCKSLRATLAGAKDFAGYDSSLFTLQLYFIGPVISTVGFGSIPAFELDIGPPFVSTFAESVLHRSILAHAPPVIA